jgi:hypothetical protein
MTQFYWTVGGGVNHGQWLLARIPYLKRWWAIPGSYQALVARYFLMAINPWNQGRTCFRPTSYLHLTTCSPIRDLLSRIDWTCASAMP